MKQAPTDITYLWVTSGARGVHDAKEIISCRGRGGTRSLGAAFDQFSHRVEFNVVGEQASCISRNGIHQDDAF